MQFKNNNIFLLIFNVILFLFQFETFGEDVFSVYRFLIFPMLCLAMLYAKLKITKEDFLCILAVFVFFIAQLLSVTLSGNYSYIINVFGQLFFFMISYSYFKQTPTITKSTLYVFASYSIFHLLFFFINFSEINLSHRFSGYHWDPNYMCGYVLIGLWAKIYLIDLTKPRFILKYLLWALSLLDVLMILSSMSKGGVLAFIASALLYTFIKHRKLFYILIAVMSICLLLILSRYDSLVWSTELNIIDSLIYRFINQSIESGDFSTGRVDFIQNYLSMVMSGDAVFLGVDMQYFIKEYNFKWYPHNGFLEILITSGLMFGILFISMLVFLLIKIILLTLMYTKLYFHVLITLSSLFVFLFLTYLGLKFFWFFIAVLVVYKSSNLYK